jgi:peroxiredoxin
MKSLNFSMYKLLPSLFALFFVVAMLTGCGSSSGAADGETLINGTVSQCSVDSIRLFEVNGTRVQQIAAAPLEKSGDNKTFSLRKKLSHPGFYMIGEAPNRATNVVLGDGGEITLDGNCNTPQQFKFVGATINDGFVHLQERMNNHNQQLNGLYQNLQIFSQTDPMQVQRIQQDIANLTKSHTGYLDSLVKAGGYLGKIAQVYHFKPYMSDPSHSQYPNEIEYFRQSFFTGLNFDDADIAGMPQLFDKARAFSGTLAGQGLPNDVLKGSIDPVLTNAKSGSVAHETLLRGFIAGLEQSKNALLVDYGKLFISTYPSSDPGFIAALNNTIAQIAATAEGGTAPDISAATPDGKTMKLSDFRGKIVMIDFWASWCRPCRMENPNVLKAYNKYHGKGFEILGVSLDQDKAKWLDAIKQDGLIWSHISDLGGWGSQPAKAYGVNSIPATVLVDKEGKIIARNLRGTALEDKLKEIFGS